MQITSLKDFFLSILQSLQISTLLPALIIVGSNLFYIFPLGDFLPKEDIIILTILGTLIISYLLYAFNGTFIRFLEGYIGWNIFPLNKIKKIRITRYSNEFDELKDNKFNADDKISLDALKKLDLYFPNKKKNLKPTELGNLIKAFEDYPFNRYGIDAVALWPRMVTVLKENKYLEVVSQKKIVFDFLLNLMLISFAIGIEIAFALYFHTRDVNLTMIAFLSTLIVISIINKALKNTALQWGNSIKVAFDLYRYNLWNKFTLKNAASFKEERAIWKELSSFIIFGDEDEDIDYDSFHIFSYKHLIKNEDVD